MTTYVALVACRDLKNDDGSSADISIVRADSGEEDEIGKTAELAGDTPVFNKFFEFECENKEDFLKVTILDENDQSRGVATFKMSTVLEHEKSLGFLEMSAGRGAVVVHVVEKIFEGSLKLKLKATDVKNVEGLTSWRRPDPFYLISKSTGEGQWDKVFQSATDKNDLDPEWEENTIDLKELCGGDLDLTLHLQVFDEEDFGRDPVIIGSFETTLNQLIEASGSNNSLTLQEGGENTGNLFVENAELEGCVNSKADAKKVMEVVAVALKNRSDANEKAEGMEALKEAAAAAQEAADAAQKVAEEKAGAVAAAEEELAIAIAAAEEAEAECGGLA